MLPNDVMLDSRRLVARLLAGDETLPLDYTVLSVAVITLGLILVVELIRHRFDVAATGRPFFKTVLEGVYRECESRIYLVFARAAAP
jgi:hypothetical protein